MLSKAGFYKSYKDFMWLWQFSPFYKEIQFTKVAYFRTSWVLLFCLLTTNYVDKNRKIFRISHQENTWDVPMFFPGTSSSHGFHISTVTNQETLVAWNIFFSWVPQSFTCEW